MLVAVGVHAGKFIAERRTESLARACLRLGVRHPVVNDRQFRVWRSYAVRAWPTLAFVDPLGYVLSVEAGEAPLAALEAFVREVVAHCEARGELVRGPFPLARAPADPDTGPLRFPGKVVAAPEASGPSSGEPLVYVADSGHHQVVELELVEPHRARELRRFGAGTPGFADGGPHEAAFREPQGLAHAGAALYVADRANHAIRRIDLASGGVETVAGTGELGDRVRPGPARETALRSPWDLRLEGGLLYVAMAGAHQIWKLELASGDLRLHAGSGAEALGDGPLLQATLAQPSGLAVAGERLWFADSESSAIRWADLDERGRVGTIVGTGLFDFGDRDGRGDEVRLQHPLGLAWRDGGLVVADTYNGKLKRVDPATRSCASWPAAGEGDLAEPSGLAVAGEAILVADGGAHRLARIAEGPARAVEVVAGD